MKKLLVIGCLVVGLLKMSSFNAENVEVQEEQTITFNTNQERIEYITSKLQVGDYTNDIVNELLLVPDEIWLSFFEDDGRIYVTGNMPEGFETRKGVFFGQSYEGEDDILKGTAEIYLNIRAEIQDSFLHELGHYYYNEFGIKHDTKFQECHTEKEKFVNELCNQDTYFMADEEFFVEAFKYYMHGELNAEEFPLTVAQFERVLEVYK